MSERNWRVVNPNGLRRVIVTKELPGDRWLQLLIDADCRIEIAQGEDTLGVDEIKAAIGDRCDAAIGQLTEPWQEPLLSHLAGAGAKLYSQYAVGFNNVDIAAATRLGLPVGNTPGVLTEATAECAVALTFAAARRIAEGERMMRARAFHGWLPTMLLGRLLYRQTVGIVGAGRIGSAYAQMMVEGHKMNLVYFDVRRNEELEQYVADYSHFLTGRGEDPVTCRRVESLEEFLPLCDVVSLHTVLDDSTRHMIGASQLALMQEDAILVNSSRGPLIDEAALVEHCRLHPGFSAALDVYENEPAMAPGLADLDNVTIIPHLGSATAWTRQWMAILAAANVAAVLQDYPVWHPITGLEDAEPFIGDDPLPHAAPSIVNAVDLGLPHITSH